jgi:tetratricopeptide (TPR) repeat protein
MLVRPAEQSFGKGIEALARGEAVKALAMFEAAIRLDRKFRAATRPQARYLSYYGLCLGLESHRWKEAVDLCREAVGAESYNPDLHLNLGRVLVAAGRRKEGWEALQRGLQVDEAHEGLRRAIAAMGVRKRPAVPLLARSHPLNKLLGKMAHQEKAKKSAPGRTAKRAPVGRRTVPGRT